MRKFYAVLVFVFLVFVAFSQSRTTYTTVASGNYDAAATWGGSAPPATLTAGNTIVVSSGHTLTINTGVIIEGTFNNYGTVALNNTFRVDGTMNQYGNACTGTATNFTLNGTLVCHTDGGSINSGYVFNNVSTLKFTGVINTSPSFTAGDAFGTLEFDCPSLATDIVIPRMVVQHLKVTDTHGNSVRVSGSGQATFYNLTIAANGKLTISDGALVRNITSFVNNAGVNGLVIKSSSTSVGGALITNSSVPATVQRYLPSRWSFFGVGTTGSTTADVTGSYFQYYTESTGEWTYVTATDYALGEAIGYAVYPQENTTAEFQGNLYTANKAFSNLSNTGSGWHILSNPYTCAIRLFNSTAWNYTNVETVVQIYNGSGWTPRNQNNYVAAQQGFAVHVTSGTNSITIPTSARIYNPIGWTKSQDAVNDVDNYIALTLSDDLGKSNDLQYILFRDDATLGYDLAYEGHEFSSEGPATEFFFIQDDELMSVLAVPFDDENKVFQIGIDKGEAEKISIKLNEVEVESSVEIVLEDLKENTFTTLDIGQSYDFKVIESDEIHRFNLHLNKANGINDDGLQLGLQTWIDGDVIYIKNSNNIFYKYIIYSMDGQIIDSSVANNSSLLKIPFNGPRGAYVIKLVANNEFISNKFIY